MNECATHMARLACIVCYLLQNFFAGASLPDRAAIGCQAIWASHMPLQLLCWSMELAWGER